ncbi:hypothetical protein PoB_004326600 [Plakobranchus ocellatus]|uniref:Uncharacterized protein n=1 Tax=Plakobranchus ocellatus TaxID=259542 RepID=A0AAV4B8J4_9GAST|nr:hypothetical protein PoB_004326600 [Plakobranchus ocellatus]
MRVGARSYFFLCTASPQEDDVKLSGPPSGQGGDGVIRTPDRRVPVECPHGCFSITWATNAPPLHPNGIIGFRVCRYTGQDCNPWQLDKIVFLCTHIEIKKTFTHLELATDKTR